MLREAERSARRGDVGSRRRLAVAGAMALVLLCCAGNAAASGDGRQGTPAPGAMMGADLSWVRQVDDQVTPAVATEIVPTPEAVSPGSTSPDLARTAQTVAFFAVVSFAPVAVMMATAFLRIQIVLLLVRQALGSPQVPGNQVLTALAALLTALVMAPTGEAVYRDAVRPYADGSMKAEEAWRRGSEPIKAFMIDQIFRTGHERYLVELHGFGRPESAEPPADSMDLDLKVVAPAFLLSEITTAFWIGFLLYLPFLVIDLVVAAVLAASGLVMMPPSQVSVPLKLVLFVLADGWWLVADGLLRTFQFAGSTG